MAVHNLSTPKPPRSSDAPALPGALRPGTRLGRYEIVSDLGAGGMATVYLGRALSVAGFARLVAIKLLHPHLLRDENFVQMFLDEGRLAARIHHPNVVATLDLERAPEGLYIVSEYIEGDQLLGLYKSARALEMRIPRGIALRIALDVLAGLQAAHELTDDFGTELKIVHRDVSPHNVLVGSDGISRLTDFGIAKAEERISDTRDGIVKGKLSYMAPEQPNDAPIDRRADLFALATVLWECLTGRRLFPGRTDAEVLQALLNRPIPRLRAVDPELPEALDVVLARALDRDPARRWQSARSFADALEAAVGPSDIASYRAVAAHVRQVAAPKIHAEQQRRRATTRDLPVFRPTAESLRDLVAVPSPGRSSHPPPPVTADEAPTHLVPGVTGSTPGSAGLVPPLLPSPADTPTRLAAADHRVSGARARPKLPPLPPAVEASAPGVERASPELPAAVAPPVPVAAPVAVASPVVEAAPLATTVRAPTRPPVTARTEDPFGRAWITLAVVALGAILGLAIWTLGQRQTSRDAPRPVIIVPPPMRPAVTQPAPAPLPLQAPSPVAVVPVQVPVVPRPSSVVARPPAAVVATPTVARPAPRVEAARPVPASPRVSEPAVPSSAHPVEAPVTPPPAEPSPAPTAPERPVGLQLPTSI